LAADPTILLARPGMALEGGLPTFAAELSDAKVAPIPDLPYLGSSILSGHSARRMKSRLLQRPDFPECALRRSEVSE
jgi:hypothetical protein